MSRDTVYAAAKLPDNKRDDISAAILSALLSGYGAGIRAQLIARGYGDRELTINDPDVVARLKRKADEQALTVITFTNKLLRAYIDKLDPSLTDEQIVAALDDFFTRTARYNQTSLAPLLTRWAQAQSVKDFTSNNLDDQDVLWRCTPDFTDSSDEDCDCPAAIAASPMSEAEAASFDMPNHPNCFHSMEPIITTEHDWPTLPWTGEVEDAGAEAA